MKIKLRLQWKKFETNILLLLSEAVHGPKMSDKFPICLQGMTHFPCQQILHSTTLLQGMTHWPCQSCPIPVYGGYPTPCLWMLPYTLSLEAALHPVCGGCPTPCLWRLPCTLFVEAALHCVFGCCPDSLSLQISPETV